MWSVRTVSVLQVPSLGVSDLAQRVERELGLETPFEVATEVDGDLASQSTTFRLAPTWVSHRTVTVRARSTGREGSELRMTSGLRIGAAVVMWLLFGACVGIVAAAAVRSFGGQRFTVMPALWWPLAGLVAGLSLREADLRAARSTAARLARP